MKVRRIARDLVTAALAGYAGTKVMEPVGMALYQRESHAARAREDQVRPGPPYRVAAEKITGAVGLELSAPAMEKVALGFHYGLAISWAPLYTLLRRRSALPSPVAALLTGVAMSAVADEALTPLAGFSAPNRAYPLVTHLRGVLGHLVFGATVGLTTEAVWALTGCGPRLAARSPR